MQELRPLSYEEVEGLVPEAIILGGLTTAAFRSAVANTKDLAVRQRVFDQIEAARRWQDVPGDGWSAGSFGPPSRATQLAAAANKALGLGPEDKSLPNFANYRDDGSYPVGKSVMQLGWRSHRNPIGSDNYMPGMGHVFKAFMLNPDRFVDASGQWLSRGHNLSPSTKLFRRLGAMATRGIDAYFRAEQRLTDRLFGSH